MNTFCNGHEATDQGDHKAETGRFPEPGQQSIGIIGVGEIASALVTGLCASRTMPPEVHLSPRGTQTSSELSARYENVHVRAGNQDVIDRSEIVFVAVRPENRFAALADLHVSADQVLVNVMAGVANSELRNILDTRTSIVRAVPLPSVRERRSVTVTCPHHPDVDALFEELGGVLSARNEEEFNVFSALTATLTTHYWYLATLTTWAEEHDVAPEDADRYVRTLFQGVGHALGDHTRSLRQLASDHETPRGINEYIRTGWFGPANAHALEQVLDTLLDDMK